MRINPFSLGFSYLSFESQAKSQATIKTDGTYLMGGEYVQGRFSENDVFFIPQDDHCSHLFICESASSAQYHEAAFTRKPAQFLTAYIDADLSCLVNPVPVLALNDQNQGNPAMHRDAHLIANPNAYSVGEGGNGNSRLGITTHHYHDSRPDRTVDIHQLNAIKLYEIVPKQSTFFRDCLTTAEDLMNNQYPDEMPEWVRSQLRGKPNLEIGDTDLQNWKIAKEYNQGVDAEPDIGQAFFTVYDAKTNKNTWKTGEMTTYGKWPYHAAAVVAKDHCHCITLEVMAGEKDATKREKDIYSFHMYTVGHPRDSFHAQLVDEAKAEIVGKISAKLCYQKTHQQTSFYNVLGTLIPDQEERHALVKTLAECAYENKSFSHRDRKVEDWVGQSQDFIQAVATRVNNKLKLPVGTVVIEAKK